MKRETESVQIVLAQHCNGYAKPRLFGGQLMAWIDVIAAVEAQRFAQSAVTTVCVDNLNFVRPAFLGDTVVQKAAVTWSGHTSLEVRVDTYVEKLDGTRELTNTAYVVFVALDENDDPRPVPEFIPQTAQEQAEYEAALERRRIRLTRGRN